MGTNCDKIPIFVKNETCFDANNNDNSLAFKNNYVGCGVSIEKPYGTFEPVFAYRVDSQNRQDVFIEGTYKTPKSPVFGVKLESRTRFFVNGITSKNGPECKVNERLCLAKSECFGDGFGVYGKIGANAEINLNKTTDEKCKEIKITPACLLGLEKNIFETNNGGKFKTYVEGFPFDKSIVAGMKFTF